MSSLIKVENEILRIDVGDCREHSSTNSGHSKDRQHENSKEQDFSDKNDPENEMNESKTEVSNNRDTKLPKSEFLQIEKRDCLDYCRPDGKSSNTKYADDRELNTKSPNREIHQTEIYEEKDSPQERKTVRSSKSLEDLYNASTEVSEEDSQKSQSQETSDNGSPIDDGSQPSRIFSPSREQPNLISYDTDEEIYGPRINLTDYADVSDGSDGIDPTFRVQRKTKKKQKVANESESDSVDEDCARKPHLLFPIRNDDSEGETTSTDYMSVCSSDHIGLEQVKQPPRGNSASSVDCQANPKTPEEVSIDNKCNNSEKPDMQSSAGDSDNLETPDNESTTDKSDKLGTPGVESTTEKRETLDDDSAMQVSDIEIFGNGSVESKTENAGAIENGGNKSYDTESDLEISLDYLEDKSSNSRKRKLGIIYEEPEGSVESENTGSIENKGNKPYDPESDLEISLNDIEDKSSNSQKRKLSTIYEEPEESRQVAKRLRPNETNEKT